MAISRILVVDDNAMFRSSLRVILEEHPTWQVSEAVDGADSVKQTRLVAPHLIIMDMSMPYMTGIQAACEILKENPKIPIILLTFHFTEHLAEISQRYGIRVALSKTDIHYLLPAVESLLRGEEFTVPFRTYS
jgi:DNA-binding NarL/FixJ family response regulator